jgi:hypothetical protein
MPIVCTFVRHLFDSYQANTKNNWYIGMTLPLSEERSPEIMVFVKLFLNNAFHPSKKMNEMLPCRRVQSKFPIPSAATTPFLYRPDVLLGLDIHYATLFARYYCDLIGFVWQGHHLYNFLEIKEKFQNVDHSELSLKLTFIPHPFIVIF